MTEQKYWIWSIKDQGWWCEFTPTQDIRQALIYDSKVLRRIDGVNNIAIPVSAFPTQSDQRLTQDQTGSTPPSTKCPYCANQLIIVISQHENS